MGSPNRLRPSADSPLSLLHIRLTHPTPPLEPVSVVSLDPGSQSTPAFFFASLSNWSMLFNKLGSPSDWWTDARVGQWKITYCCCLVSGPDVLSFCDRARFAFTGKCGIVSSVVLQFIPHLNLDFYLFNLIVFHSSRTSGNLALCLSGNNIYYVWDFWYGTFNADVWWICDEVLM